MKNAEPQFCLQYNFLQEFFNVRLRENNLIYELLISHNKLVINIIKEISFTMIIKHSYVFTSFASIYRSHETLYLRLLRIHDCALTRVEIIIFVHLKCFLLKPTWMIYDLLRMKHKFTILNITLENNCFILFMSTLS